MNNDFKKIAKQLGIVIPACLLSMGVAKAETANDVILPKVGNVAISEITKNNLVKNEVVNYLTTDFTKNMDVVAPDHTNYHTNAGGDHANHHSNTSHTNSHSNIAAQTKYNRVQQPDGKYTNVPYCEPHSNSHTDSGTSVNQHTNRGNQHHTDAHTDKVAKTNC